MKTMSLVFLSFLLSGDPVWAQSLIQEDPDVQWVESSHISVTPAQKALFVKLLGPYASLITHGKLNGKTANHIRFWCHSNKEQGDDNVCHVRAFFADGSTDGFGIVNDSSGKDASKFLSVLNDVFGFPQSEAKRRQYLDQERCDGCYRYLKDGLSLEYSASRSAFVIYSRKEIPKSVETETPEEQPVVH